MTKKPIPKVKHPLDALGVPEGPEYRDVSLATSRAIFEKDSSSALPAFFALAHCVVPQWTKLDQDDPAMIQIPYWAAHAIVIGFINYREAYRGGRTTTFGEAFCVEGGGQGKQRKLARFEQELQKMNITLAIVVLQGKGQRRIDAIRQICNDYKIDERTAQRYLKEWGALARRQLAIHLGDNSSGGSVAP
jgi:hypothetical protein